MITKRHILRAALLQSLRQYALTDGRELVNRLKQEGRIAEVHYFGEGDSDFYNLCIDYAEWQQDESMETSVRLGLTISVGHVIEYGTLLVSGGVVWVEDQLVSL
jgi:hypothetical protein